MEVFDSSGNLIHDGQVVKDTNLVDPPTVKWPDMYNGQYYTIAMQSDRIHFLAVNIPSNARIVIPYKPPTPGDYQLSVYTQQEHFSVFSATSHDDFTFPLEWHFTREISMRFRVVDPPKSKEGYFKLGHTLTPGEEKFCRCTLHVMAKQPEKCLQEHSFGTAGCANPYAICAASTRTSVGRSNKCTINYEYEGIPDTELQAYAQLEGVSVPHPYDRTAMITNLNTWRNSK